MANPKFPVKLVFSREGASLKEISEADVPPDDLNDGFIILDIKSSGEIHTLSSTGPDGSHTVTLSASPFPLI